METDKFRSWYNPLMLECGVWSTAVVGVSTSRDPRSAMLTNSTRVSMITEWIRDPDIQVEVNTPLKVTYDNFIFIFVIHIVYVLIFFLVM